MLLVGKRLKKLVIDFLIGFSIVKQALKVESGFICLMTLFLVIAIIPMCTLLIWCCSSHKPDDTTHFQQPNGDDDMQTDPIISFDDTNTIDSTLYCRRVLQFLLQFFSLFLV